MTLYRTLLCRSPEGTDLSTAPTTSNKDKVLECFQEFLDMPNHEEINIVDFFKKADVDMIDFLKKKTEGTFEDKKTMCTFYGALTEQQQQSLKTAEIPFFNDKELREFAIKEMFKSIESLDDLKFLMEHSSQFANLVKALILSELPSGEDMKKVSLGDAKRVRALLDSLTKNEKEMLLKYLKLK